LTEENAKRAELMRAIDKAPGMAHVNRTYQRSFSFNIFRMNAQELIEITRHIHDPDEGLRLMSQDNRDAGQQVHREVNRRVHNFAAAALTLVEHTRAFMREQYKDTAALDAYQEKVKADFSNEPVARFAQDLRNYMVHKGLPNSQMFLHFDNRQQSPDSGPSLETGISFSAESLLEWNGWSDPARGYIESCGEAVSIKGFAEAYTEKAMVFHSWLQRHLDQVHASDLIKLAELQKALAEIIVLPHQNPVAPTTAPNDKPTSENDNDVDTGAATLLGKLEPIDLAPKAADTFRSDRIVAAKITDADIIGEMTFWGTDKAGRRVFIFTRKDDEAYGFGPDAFEEMTRLVERILKLGWAIETLSRSFIQGHLIDWLRETFHGRQSDLLSETLRKAAADTVQPQALWAPIANLEVEERFDFGPVEIAPLTKEFFDGLEDNALKKRPQQESQIRQAFDRFRKRMQGLSAVVIKISAVPDRVQEDIVPRTIVGGQIAKAPATHHTRQRLTRMMGA
jgi:hypothetical protein